MPKGIKDVIRKQVAEKVEITSPLFRDEFNKRYFKTITEMNEQELRWALLYLYNSIYLYSKVTVMDFNQAIKGAKK